MSTGTQRFSAYRDIDEAAGQARLRYITDVPGQQAVYVTKLQEAAAFAAAHAVDSGASVPPYIAAEAAATKAAAIDVAQNVIGLANYWNGSVGPAIEGARLGGKAAVAMAADADAIEEARAAAVAAFDAFPGQ